MLVLSLMRLFVLLQIVGGLIQCGRSGDNSGCMDLVDDYDTDPVGFSAEFWWFQN